MFFDPKFDLTNSKTFATVVEQQGSEDALDPASLSHSLPLLEKLSHHADIVEQHLIQEISRRSSSFFAALTNLRELQTESGQCLERIGELRRSLKDLDDNSAKRGLQAIRLEGRLKNISTVQNGIKAVVGINEAFGVAKGLAAAGEWNDSLGMIENLHGLWELKDQNIPQSISHSSPSRPKSSSTGKRMATLETVPESSESEHESLVPNNAPSFPISSLQAFASLPDHLRDLTFDIASTLSTDLVNVLKVDFILRLDAPHSSPSDDVPDVDQTFKDRLPSQYSRVSTRIWLYPIFRRWHRLLPHLWWINAPAYHPSPYDQSPQGSSRAY